VRPTLAGVSALDHHRGEKENISIPGGYRMERRERGEQQSFGIEKPEVATRKEVSAEALKEKGEEDIA